jgi:hypothetical protein
MMMGMLHAGGLPLVTDGERRADDDNPRGYFEDERVKRLDRTADVSWLAGCRGKGVKIISYLLEHLPPEHDYRVLFMRRELDEVVASQNAMLLRRGEPRPTAADDERMRQAYERHLLRVEQVLARPGITRLDVAYRSALDAPRVEAARIREFLGLPLDVEAMARAVDRSLWRNRGLDQPSAGRR